MYGFGGMYPAGDVVCTHRLSSPIFTMPPIVCCVDVFSSATLFPCPLLAVALCPYAKRPCWRCLRFASCASVRTLDKGRFLPRLVVGKYARAERCHTFRSFVCVCGMACLCVHTRMPVAHHRRIIYIGPPAHVALSQVCEMHLHDCPSHSTQSTDNVRRIAKRVTGYCAILRTPEYYAAYCLWYQGRIASMPPEPDPYDLNVSKRTWEASVQHWRNELRTLQNATPQ